MFAHTLWEDKTAAWQMQTTLCERVMQAESVAMYRRLHTHTHLHTHTRPGYAWVIAAEGAETIF